MDNDSVAMIEEVDESQHVLVDREAWILRSGTVTFSHGEYVDDFQNGR